MEKNKMEEHNNPNLENTGSEVQEATESQVAVEPKAKKAFPKLPVIIGAAVAGVALITVLLILLLGGGGKNVDIAIKENAMPQSVFVLGEEIDLSTGILIVNDNGKTTEIAMNAEGVMPIIFASALLTFPQLIMSIFWPNSDAMQWYNTNMGAGSWPYIVLTALLILFFAYFYSQISFNPDDISKQIQQNGGFIPGIRPGKPTADYLRKISNRVVLFGAIFLAFIALVPNLVFKGISGDSALINGFSATSLLIVVSVALEFDKQLEAQLLMRNYRGFLK